MKLREADDLSGADKRPVELDGPTSLEPHRSHTCVSQLAHRSMRQALSQYKAISISTTIRLEGLEFPTPVIFAEEGEPSLLGVVTLEEAALAVDPLAGRLIPANLLRL